MQSIPSVEACAICIFTGLTISEAGVDSEHQDSPKSAFLCRVRVLKIKPVLCTTQATSKCVHMLGQCHVIPTDAHTCMYIHCSAMLSLWWIHTAHNLLTVFRHMGKS